jgi:hypothetical protein
MPNNRYVNPTIIGVNSKNHCIGSKDGTTQSVKAIFLPKVYHKVVLTLMKLILLVAHLNMIMHVLQLKNKVFLAIL